MGTWSENADRPNVVRMWSPVILFQTDGFDRHPPLTGWLYQSVLTWSYWLSVWKSITLLWPLVKLTKYLSKSNSKFPFSTFQSHFSKLLIIDQIKMVSRSISKWVRVNIHFSLMDSLDQFIILQGLFSDDRYLFAFCATNENTLW